MVVIEDDEPSLLLRIELFQAWQTSPRGEDSPRVAVPQDVREIVITELDIDRHDHRPSPNHPERSHDPFRSVFREEHDAVALPKATPDEALCKRVRAFGNLAIGPMLCVLLAQRQQSGFVATLA